MSAKANDAHPLDADLLTALVYTVEGVIDVFPPAPTLTLIPEVLTAIVTGSPPVLNRVGVSTNGDTTALTVRVGTSIDAATPDTAKRVADILLDAVIDSIPDGHDATVTVQVSRIA
jgi:hypothetical protein